MPKADYGFRGCEHVATWKSVYWKRNTALSSEISAKPTSRRGREVRTDMDIERSESIVKLMKPSGAN